MTTAHYCGETTPSPFLFILWTFVQLVLASGPTTHLVQLHLVTLVRGLLFLWEARCFPNLFRCLLLKYISIQNGVTSIIAPLTLKQLLLPWTFKLRCQSPSAQTVPFLSSQTRRLWTWNLPIQARGSIALDKTTADFLPSLCLLPRFFAGSTPFCRRKFSLAYSLTSELCCLSHDTPMS
jgi:hypothetical protein